MWRCRCRGETYEFADRHEAVEFARVHSAHSDEAMMEWLDNEYTASEVYDMLRHAKTTESVMRTLEEHFEEAETMDSMEDAQENDGEFDAFGLWFEWHDRSLYEEGDE